MRVWRKDDRTRLNSAVRKELVIPPPMLGCSGSLGFVTACPEANGSGEHSLSEPERVRKLSRCVERTRVCPNAEETRSILTEWARMGFTFVDRARRRPNNNPFMDPSGLSPLLGHSYRAWLNDATVTLSRPKTRDKRSSSLLREFRLHFFSFSWKTWCRIGATT